jgi:hypothetical protein
MRLSGSASWRLSSNSPQSLDIALFVRDSVGLVPPPSPEVPPALTTRTSDHTAVLTDAARIEAGEQWLDWWRQLIAHESAPRPSSADDEEMVAQGRRRIAAYQRIMDPPDFESMADLPALRTAVAATFFAASGWLSATRRSAGVDHTMVREVAEEVIAAHGVSPDRVDATVHVLHVTGAWSYVARPGVVFCSVGVANDPVAGRALLREAFVSGLDA